MVLEEREAGASFPGASRRVTEIEVDMSEEVDRSLLPIRRPPFKGGGARKLKAALAEAQAGMGG